MNNNKKKNRGKYGKICILAKRDLGSGWLAINLDFALFVDCDALKLSEVTAD